ncbi:MAG: hypothetical protein NTV01_01250, partial [Bacteroidia bacterium]|nr:hypothetical protein [Bacteroidia bacterium]
MTQLEPHIFEFKQPLQLESGATLRKWQVAFHTFGSLNETLDNVIWVCHALTANSDVYDWWPGMVGPGCLMDTDKYFIICANIPGLLADETFAEGRADGGSKGIRAARAMALLSYRNRNTYQNTQTDPDEDKLENFKASSYQQYQGQKLDRRFNAYSYNTVSKTLDSRNVGRNRGGLDRALSGIKAKTIAVGISSDLLFPPEEQKLIAQLV